MRRLAAAFLLVTAAAAPAPPSNTPSPERLRATVEKLVSFGTRHTLSTVTDRKRGIGAARNWAASEFAALGKACGGCLTIERPAARFEGPRAPNGAIVEDVLAIQRGSEEPNRVIIIAGHIDSRASDVANATIDAPGANDDGSGNALVLEAARILSRTPHRATIVYALLSGEEQGLWGGKLLATTAKAKGWTVSAMLNNDIVGNTLGQDGRIVADRVRIFSEGIGAADDAATIKWRRASGGEDDGPSRALAKAVAMTAQDGSTSLSTFLVRRPDRFGRGGDHTPMLEAGFPAIRFTSGIELYDAQHQDLRTESGKRYGDTPDRMDFAYLARVTALNIAVAARLANAPDAPDRAMAGGAVSSETQLSWVPVRGAAGYRVRWRRADRSGWESVRDVPKGTTSVTLPGVIVDDHLFGVSALAASGEESLATFAGLPR